MELMAADTSKALEAERARRMSLEKQLQDKDAQQASNERTIAMLQNTIQGLRVSH